MACNVFVVFFLKEYLRTMSSMCAGLFCLLCKVTYFLVGYFKELGSEVVKGEGGEGSRPAGEI